MKRVILIKYGELSTKKGNRNFFINTLYRMINEKLKNFDVKIFKDRSRMYIEFLDEDLDKIKEKLDSVFGIHMYHIAYIVDTNIEAIKELLISLVGNMDFKTFKVEVKRSDKSFSMHSQEMNRFLGGVVLKNKDNISVDVHNPDVLIKAFLTSSSLDFKLVIAGSNDVDLDYVKSLHVLSRNNSQIVFTGAVYGADKETLLRNAYYFCIPSTIEGLSIALLEAMSYKIPIISSNIPANKEVLGDDKAIWVEAENESQLAAAIEKAINFPGLLNDAVKYNHSFICNNYTWPQIAAKYIDYLRSL